MKLEIETARKVLSCIRRTEFVAVGLSVIALLLLTTAFLTDDFSIAAVGQYRSAGLAFFYKLSAVWAGSAGSLLLSAEINLKGLPYKEHRFGEIVCVVGLLLIVIVALLTLYWKREKIRVEGSDNETCSE